MPVEPDEISEGLSRKERERLRHRREILAAGERVFARKGYYNATVEEIAREAEFAVGTIYNFFDGKEALYTSIVKDILENFFEIFDNRVLAATSPVVAIARLVELRVAQFEQHRGLFQVVFGTLPAGHLDPVRVLPQELLHYHQRYFRELCGIFERGRANGLFGEEEPMALALTLDGIVNAFISYWSRTMEGQLPPLQAINLQRLVFRALGCDDRTPTLSSDMKGD